MFDGFGFCPIVRFEWHASFGIARWKLKGQLGETRDDRRGAMWKNNETCTRRAWTIAIFRVFDREMEENGDVYECSNEMYNFPLGIKFLLRISLRRVDRFTSRVDHYIFLFQSSWIRSRCVSRYRETSGNFERTTFRLDNLATTIFTTS